MKSEIEIHDRYAMLQSGTATIESFPIENDDELDRIMQKASMEFDGHKLKSALMVYKWYFRNGGCRSEPEVKLQILELEDRLKSNMENIKTANFLVKAKLLLNIIGHTVARGELLWILGEANEG